MNRKTPHSIYFDCTSWSDFIEEDEKLFIGGLDYFEFQTILNLGTSPVSNYQLYVEVMMMLKVIIEGWPWVNMGIKIKKKHSRILQMMITEEMNGNYSMSSDSKSVIPHYIRMLFHNAMQKCTDLEVDWC